MSNPMTYTGNDDHSDSSDEKKKDYISYRIMEVLKQDKFMSSLDNRNNFHEQSFKRRKISDSNE